MKLILFLFDIDCFPKDNLNLMKYICNAISQKVHHLCYLALQIIEQYYGNQMELIILI